ncbi:MAG: hypothetical protein HY720_10225 [Planctomycetes bacterium]|nr:hypothetical protein [Planctomycetota bacterium]
MRQGTGSILRGVALVGILGALAAGVVRGQDARAVEVTAGTLNVRTGVWGTLVGEVNSGTRLAVIGEQSGWLKVWYEGRSAWIYGGYTKPVREGTIEEVTASALNVRTGPGTGYRSIGLAGRGQRYVRAGTSGAWRKIWFGRILGWVHGGYTKALAIGGSQPPPPPPPGAPPGSWVASHAGLDLSGSHIPRAGVSNATLRRALGIAVEPYGRVESYEGRSFVRGKTSSFGGPNDFGVTSTETGAITGERLRSLNSPLSPDAATLARRPQDFYYVAMRWDYSPNGRDFWKNARILVLNPKNGRAIVVRPVDWGPNTRTGRIVDLSPQAMKDLGLATDQDALVAFARPGTPLGVVR